MSNRRDRPFSSDLARFGSPGTWPAKSNLVMFNVPGATATARSINGAGTYLDSNQRWHDYVATQKGGSPRWTR
jgi:hypothetical protein